MDFLQNIYGILLRPRTTFKDLNDNYNSSLILQSFLLLVFVILLSQGLEIKPSIANFCKWFCVSSLIFLTAYVFVAKGKDYWKLLSLMALANLPAIFYSCLDMIALANSLLASFLKLGLEFWILNLNIIVIASVFEIQRRKVLLLYLTGTLWIIFFILSFLCELIDSLKSL